MEAYQTFARKHGRRPTYEDLRKDASLPAPATVSRVWQTHSNVEVVAFGSASPIGVSHHKDADTWAAIQDVRSGKTLTECAKDRGITVQSMGRRIRRYKKMFGDRAPVV